MDIRKLNMTEPTTTAGGTLLAQKLVMILLPVVASLLAFWLGLRFVPIRQGHEREDMINRVMACLYSSFIVGITLLVVLYHHFPGLFETAGKLSEHTGLPTSTGFFVLTACILIVSAIPGPWIVSAAFLWLEKRRGKDIGELLNDARADLKHDVRSQWYPHASPNTDARLPTRCPDDVTCEGCATGLNQATEQGRHDD